MPGTEKGGRKLAFIHELLSRPKDPPSKKWARELLERHAAGARLSPIQVQLAKEALEPRYGRRGREPGEDDQ